MGHYDRLAPEEQARITEIQDLLIERYIERKEETEKGNNSRTDDIEAEIKELRREKEQILERATASSA